MNQYLNAKLTAAGTARLPKLLAASLLSLILVLAMAAAATAATALPEGQSAPVAMPQPLAGVTVQSLVGRIISTVLGFAGVVALVMFIYGGVTWMLASGNEEKVTSARKTVIWATLGLFMVFGSYMIVSLVMNYSAMYTMK